MKELENNWIEKWESVKEKTVCPVDLNTLIPQHYNLTLFISS